MATYYPSPPTGSSTPWTGTTTTIAVPAPLPSGAVIIHHLPISGSSGLLVVTKGLEILATIYKNDPLISGYSLSWRGGPYNYEADMDSLLIRLGSLLESAIDGFRWVGPAGGGGGVGAWKDGQQRRNLYWDNDGHSEEHGPVGRALTRVVY